MTPAYMYHLGDEDKKKQQKKNILTAIEICGMLRK